MYQLKTNRWCKKQLVTCLEKIKSTRNLGQSPTLSPPGAISPIGKENLGGGSKVTWSEL